MLCYVRFTLFAIGSGGQELELLARDSAELTTWKTAFESARNDIITQSDASSGSGAGAGSSCAVTKTPCVPTTKVKGTGGAHEISGMHKLTDIGIPNTLKVSYEMQITYEVLGQSNGVVLHYDEAISPASDELCRSEKRYLHSFEAALPPQVRFLPPTTTAQEDFFSLLMVDPDYPSVQNPLFREHVHWVSECPVM